MINQHEAHSGDIMTHIGNFQSHPHHFGHPQPCYSGGQVLNGRIYLIFEGGLGVLHFCFSQITSICFAQGNCLLGWLIVLCQCLNYFFSNSATPLWHQHHHHLHCSLAPPNTDWGQSVFQVGERCIVLPQLCTHMSFSQTGPLTLGQ